MAHTHRTKSALNFNNAIAATGLASAAFHIKAEPSCFIPPHFGFLGLGKQFADSVKYPCIGGRIGTGCPSDRRLVNINDFVDMLQPFDTFMFARMHLGIFVQTAGQRLIQNFIDQRTFPGAGYTGLHR